MTQVGKILVLVIMAFSLIFLGISTMVFVTSKNWKDATAKRDADLKKVKGELQTEQSNLALAKKSLEEAQANFQATTKALNSRIQTLSDQNKRDMDQITEARKNLEAATQNAKTALEQAADRLKETTLLREQKAAVEKQANEFELRQAELNDHIRELERMKAVADKNNSDLRERVAKYTTLLQSNGLTTDITQIKGLEAPPPVRGEVKRVDSTNKRLEITIGADDGLVNGHTLFLFRTSPRAEYLGRVQVIMVEPDQSVARVMGGTVQGKKIKEGDIVSSTIIPRF